MTTNQKYSKKKYSNLKNQLGGMDITIPLAGLYILERLALIKN